MNVFNIENAFRLKMERRWDRIYVVVDAHGTLIKPRQNTIEIYPPAVEVMRWFNSRHDISTILWTSTHQPDLSKIILACEELNFGFNSVNHNTNEPNTELSCFDQKFYFNILLDDKAGFEPETDWDLIKLELMRIGEWNKLLL